MADSLEITWRDLYTLLRRLGFVQAADCIEAWQDEYLPDEIDKPLPRED